MKIQVILLLILFSFQFNSSALNTNSDEITPRILILHSNNLERTTIVNAFHDINLNLQIETSLISSVYSLDFDEFDMILFVSSTDFELDEEDEDKFITYLSDPTKYFTIFSPYLENIENDDIKQLLGINNIGDVIPSSQSANWNVTLDKNLGNLTSGDIIAYTGQYSELQPTAESEIIASVIAYDFENEEEEEEVSFPQAAIINSTTDKAVIITSTLSPISNFVSSQLALSQLPQLYEMLIFQIIMSNLSGALQKITTFNPNTTSTQNLDTSSESKGILGLGNPSDPNLGSIILLGTILLLGLLLAKILGILDWISRKLIWVGIGIVGVFYDVEDRILTHKDVYLNNSRAEIIDYLEIVGKYGAHVREIKSVTKLGSGALMWHLKVLEDFNWIIKYKVGNYSIYVSQNYETFFDPYLKKLELNISSKYTYSLLQAIGRISFSSSITIFDIEENSGVPNRAIRRLIKRMDEMEILEIVDKKPIRFQIYNFSIFKNLLDSLTLRESYTRFEPVLENDRSEN